MTIAFTLGFVTAMLATLTDSTTEKKDIPNLQDAHFKLGPIAQLGQCYQSANNDLAYDKAYFDYTPLSSSYGVGACAVYALTKQGFLKLGFTYGRRNMSFNQHEFNLGVPAYYKQTLVSFGTEISVLAGYSFMVKKKRLFSAGLGFVHNRLRPTRLIEHKQIQGGSKHYTMTYKSLAAYKSYQINTALAEISYRPLSEPGKNFEFTLSYYYDLNPGPEMYLQANTYTQQNQLIETLKPGRMLPQNSLLRFGITWYPLQL